MFCEPSESRIASEILSRSRYDEVEVHEGDTLELVHFVGGGS